MVEPGKQYLVMGLLNTDSIAYHIGEKIRELGGRVIYTALNERMKRIFLDRSKTLSEEELAALDIRYCDVTNGDEVQALFEGIGELAGVVHSIAYGNPKTCLGEEFHTDAIDDLTTAYHISAVSLATVTRYAQPCMPDGGSVVALSFDSRRTFPYYNWMGVNKAALEAVVRGLARRHGRDAVRVNAISSGPLATKAANSIPGFGELSSTWQQHSPLPWDAEADKTEVANAVAFLLGPYAKKITGQTIYVDGGVSVSGGEILKHETGAP